MRREADDATDQIQSLLVRMVSANVVELQVMQTDTPFGVIALCQRPANELFGYFRGAAFIHSPDTLLHRNRRHIL